MRISLKSVGPPPLVERDLMPLAVLFSGRPWGGIWSAL